MTAPYRGRFAPTPSGPLHFGSLVAAVGSYLDARRHGGEWLVRMEDLDPPRIVPGAAEHILRTLEAFGFEWDGPVMWQSSRRGAYWEAIESLRKRDLVFACGCPRGGCIGTCRDDAWMGVGQRSWRVRARGENIEWSDRRCGPQREGVPDFVVLRADGVFAYQLAVVVDDAEQGITDVVRGEDLLDSTARQIWLGRRLGYPALRYEHLPIARNEAGDKLGKQTGARAISAQRGGEELAAAFRFLGIELPDGLCFPEEIWSWALRR